MTEQQKTKIYREIERIRLRYDALFFKKLKRFYEDESILIIAKLKINNISNLDEFFSNRALRLFETLYPLYQAAIKDCYLYQQNLNGNPEYKASFIDAVSKARDYVTKRVSSIVTTTKTQVNKIIQSGNKVIENVKNWYNNPGRIMRISKTEVNTAANVGIVESAEFSGKKNKIWISRRDNLVRETHQLIDGEEQKIEDIFSNDCYFPGDPNGPASETINCRCFLIFK